MYSYKCKVAENPAAERRHSSAQRVSAGYALSEANEPRAPEGRPTSDFRIKVALSFPE